MLRPACFWYFLSPFELVASWKTPRDSTVEFCFFTFTLVGFVVGSINSFPAKLS